MIENPRGGSLPELATAECATTTALATFCVRRAEALASAFAKGYGGPPML